jgi:hypothetical protein
LERNLKLQWFVRRSSRCVDAAGYGYSPLASYTIERELFAGRDAGYHLNSSVERAPPLKTCDRDVNSGPTHTGNNDDGALNILSKSGKKWRKSNRVRTTPLKQENTRDELGELGIILKWRNR